MTHETTNERAGAERPALARLVDDPTVFAADIWGRAAHLHHSPQGEAAYADLLDLAAVDELLSRRGVRTPFMRVAKSGTTLPDRAFTAAGGVGAGVGDQLDDARLFSLFADGHTLVLQGLHRLWPSIIDFAGELSDDLGHPVQANAYITPPQSQGFSAHYDVHDVFVLQVAGEKDWIIHEPVHPWPLRDQPWGDRRAEVEEAADREPVLRTRLAPGDCLYLPRGYLHSAQALGQVSAHLTIGVHTWTMQTIAEHLSSGALRRAAIERDGRAPLSLGVDVGDPAAVADAVEATRERLIEAIRSVPAQEVADALLGGARTGRRAAPVSPLAQAAALTDIGPTTSVTVRAGLHLRRRDLPDDAVELAGRGVRVVVPAQESAGLDAVLTPRAVTRLADLPMDTDLATALVRRLLAAAVVVPADPAG